MIRGSMLEKHYLILSQEEEYSVRQQILNSKERKIIVKYQVMDFDGEPTALTQQVLPEGLNMQEYELKFNKNERRINEVLNKTFGPVEFEGQQLD